MDNLSIKEAARRTGMSQAWWRQRVFQRDLKYLKIGKRVLIPESTIEEVLERAIVEPKEGGRYAGMCDQDPGLND